MKNSNFIPLDQLRHRAVYTLASRNLLIGVWDAGRQGFVGVREKMGSTYLFTEYHYDLSGTANALEEVALILPNDLELRESLPPVCDTHSQAVVFTTPIAKSGDGWVHVDHKERCDGIPVSSVNKELFELLEPIHRELRIKEKRDNEIRFS